MKKELKHLAVVIELGALPAPGEREISPGDAESLLRLFGLCIELCFDRLPDLRMLSLFSTDLQRCCRRKDLPAPLVTALRTGFQRLERLAVASEAVFAGTGRLESLPSFWRSLVPIPPPPADPRRRVNLFLNYSSREEIASAAAACLRENPDGEFDEEIFGRHLLTAGQPDPDLVVFAGGSLDPKDFLLWQSSYAEIWHRQGRGLDFSGSDLLEAFDCYFSRERRFGKV